MDAYEIRRGIENRVREHSRGGGHYLLCDCAWCASQKRYHHIQHDQTCKRKPRVHGAFAFTSACSNHGNPDCHCDCAK